MKTRYWYGKSIKNPQKALAAFFDFQDIKSALSFVSSMCTYAASDQKYQPLNIAQCILNFYALQSLLVCCHNLINNKDWQVHFNKLLLQQMDANQAMATKDSVMKAMNATYKLYTLKKWRLQLFELLSDAVYNKDGNVAYNVMQIHLYLTDFLLAAHTIHTCSKEKKVIPK